MKRTSEDDQRDYLTVGKLRKIIENTPKEQDNCLVTTYEYSGKFDYAYPIKNAYVGKTYVRDVHWPILRTLQLQFEDENFLTFLKPEKCDDIELKYGIEKLEKLIEEYKEALNNYKYEED